MAADVAGAPTLTFARTDYSSFSGARAIVTADFDRDGWLDIIQANVSPEHRHRPAEPAGALASDRLPTCRSPPVLDVTTADFDNDGVADLAVANADASSITVLLGLGDGRFARKDRSIFPIVSPRGIAAADWNKDGIADLLLTGYNSGSAQILIGAGDGSFEDGPAHTGSARGAQGIAEADFNHDGLVDAAVACDGTDGLLVLLRE